MIDWPKKLKEYGVTFRSLDKLLNMTIPQVRQYLALNEAKASSKWTSWYLYHLSHASPNVYQELHQHANKETASYIACLFLSCGCHKKEHNKTYKGFLKYEQYYRSRTHTHVEIEVEGILYEYALNLSSFSSRAQ